MKNISGFTFIETIISMVIFSIIVLMSSSFMSFGKDSEIRSKNMLFAVELAEKQLETMKYTLYTAIEAYAAAENAKPPVLNPDTGISFSTNIVVTVVGGYKEIRVTESWSAMSLALNTIVAPEY